MGSVSYSGESRLFKVSPLHWPHTAPKRRPELASPAVRKHACPAPVIDAVGSSPASVTVLTLAWHVPAPPVAAGALLEDVAARPKPLQELIRPLRCCCCWGAPLVLFWFRFGHFCVDTYRSKLGGSQETVEHYTDSFLPGIRLCREDCPGRNMTS